MAFGIATTFDPDSSAQVLRNAHSNYDPHPTTCYDFTVAMPTYRSSCGVGERIGDYALIDSYDGIIGVSPFARIYLTEQD